MHNNLQRISKFASDFLPIVVFFICYKFYNIKIATISIVITTSICTAILYKLEKKISYMSLITLVMIVFFGGMTILSGDTVFIKIKPTVVNLVFFLILSIGALFRKGLLKYLIGNNFQMSEKNWIILSLRFAFFFLLVAILNEVIWRNFAENIWVNFKVFGIVVINIIFVFTQLPFMQNARTDK